MSKAAVYRVQLDDVPELTEEELRIAISGNLVSDEDTIINHVGLFPSCYSAKEESVALVKFTNTPKFLSSLVKNPDDSRTISLSNGVSAEFDRKFNGFTPVNRPDEAEGIEADIIAISGIGGHAYGSWAYSQDGTTFMWIQDALPKMFPHCRIMLYGYESKLDSVSTNRISDYCAGLQEHLNLVRKSEEERTRPVIFISHSFGGIIAANTLIQAQLGFDRAFYNAMDAFFFFGTPHKGLSVQEILDMLVDPNHPRVDLLGQIDSKNKFLGDQLRNFKNVLGDRKVTSFYETKLTRKLVKGDDGRWSRSGPYLELSSQENSLLGLNDALEKKISVDEDHSNMVKFKSRRVAAYRSLVDALKDVLPEAQERVLGRTDPSYCPGELNRWLSNIDFKEWEAEHIKSSEVVDIGKIFLGSEVFRAWEKKEISHLECYGALGSGKTYLAYQTVQRLHDPRSLHYVVRIYIERDTPISTESLLGAMLNQLLSQATSTLTSSYVVPTKLRLYHFRTSREKRKPAIDELVKLISNAISKKAYVFVVVDGFTEASEVAQQYLHGTLCSLSAKHPNRIGALYFKRNDGNIPPTGAYCNICGKQALIHYRCQHPECFDSNLKFDLCQGCFSLDDGGKHHACHKSSLMLERNVVYNLPSRIAEMEEFIKAKVEKLVRPLQTPLTEYSNERGVNPSRLAVFCHKDPALAKEIPKCISAKLWGINFRAADEWFELLSKKTTKNGVKETLAQFAWRGRVYERDVNYIKNDDTADAQTGWKIVCLLVAAQNPISPADLNTALATLMQHSLPESDDDTMEIKTMLELARGTVFRDWQGNIRPDYAFHTFFRSEAASDILLEAHCTMAKACVNYLVLKIPQLLKVNNYQSNMAYWKEPFLGYATAFWGDHVRIAGEKLAPEVFEDAFKLLENAESMGAYIRAAWVSNLRREKPLQWDVNSGVHALHVCAWFGLSSLIKRICRGITVDQLETTFGQTPLMYACRKGHEEAATTLLELGANPGLFSKRGHSALIEAVIVDETRSEPIRSRIRIIELFKDHGKGHSVLVNATHCLSRRRTALHIAVLKGHNDIVKHLLSSSASPNCFDDRGFTPLMYAVTHGKADMVDSLLNHGASPDIYGPKWRFRTTALHIAVEKYPDDPENAENYRNIAASLISYKAHPGMQDIWGLDVIAKSKRNRPGMSELFTGTELPPWKGKSRILDMVFSEPPPDRVLDLAVSNCDVRQVEDILREKPSLARTKDRCGRTPLHLAANNCHSHLDFIEDKDREMAVNTIVALLAEHSNLAATDKWGLTAMNYAVYNQYSSIQMELLEKGAILDAKQHDGMNTFLAFAYRDQKPRAAGTLLRLGADELEAYSKIVRERYLTISFADLQHLPMIPRHTYHHLKPRHQENYPDRPG